MSKSTKDKIVEVLGILKDLILWENKHVKLLVLILFKGVLVCQSVG